jgi:hypothetical protein
MLARVVTATRLQHLVAIMRSTTSDANRKSRMLLEVAYGAVMQAWTRRIAWQQRPVYWLLRFRFPAPPSGLMFGPHDATTQLRDGVKSGECA